MKTTTYPSTLSDRLLSLEEILINTLPVPAHPETTFDDAVFRSAVARSVSITPEEKVSIIAAVPSLTQKQVDCLLGIFADEAAAFDVLVEQAGCVFEIFADEAASFDVLMEQANAAARSDANDPVRRGPFRLVPGGRS